MYAIRSYYEKEHQEGPNGPVRQGNNARFHEEEKYARKDQKGSGKVKAAAMPQRYAGIPQEKTEDKGTQAQRVNRKPAATEQGKGQSHREDPDAQGKENRNNFV